MMKPGRAQRPSAGWLSTGIRIVLRSSASRRPFNARNRSAAGPVPGGHDRCRLLLGHGQVYSGFARSGSVKESGRIDLTRYTYGFFVVALILSYLCVYGRYGNDNQRYQRCAARSGTPVRARGKAAITVSCFWRLHFVWLHTASRTIGLIAFRIRKTPSCVSHHAYWLPIYFWLSWAMSAPFLRRKSPKRQRC